MGWRNAEQRAFMGAAMGYGGMSSWQSSTFAGVRMPTGVGWQSILNGVYYALNNTENGGSVNLRTGGVTAFSYTQSWQFAASHAMQYSMTNQAITALAFVDLQKTLENPNYARMCACLDGNSFQNLSNVGNKHLKRDFKSLYVSQIKSLVKNLRISKEGEPGYDPDILPNPHYYPRQLAKEFAKISRPKLIDKEDNTLVLSRAYVSIGYIQLQSAKNPYGLSHPFSQMYNFEFDYIPFFDFNQKEVRNPGINKSFSVKGSGGHVYWFDLLFKIQ
jgi:hypothetical protein